MRFRQRHTTAEHTCVLRDVASHPQVFRDFYDTYAQRILRYMTRHTFDAQVAYDLHAEVFAAAWEARQTFRGTTEQEETAWLWTIARRELGEYWRRGRVAREAMKRLALDRQVLDDEDIDRVVELAGLDDLRPVLAAAMAALPADQREAVELRVVAELSYTEIAERLGVTNDVVRARVSRGLRALYVALGQEEYATA